MKLILSILAFAISTSYSLSQTYLDSTINSATKKVLFADPNVFSIGSYGEAHYNQNIVDNSFQNGKADLHRVILFMGYKFTKNLQFFSEIEFEHVTELAVEQAYLNYSYNSFFNIKAGVILIPMGYVNEFHEPTLFNGVERPNVDKYIIPSTWHEMGVGFHGLLKKANLKYQLYLVNGLNSYNGGATLSGKSGIRSARQGGGESIMRSPAVTGKLSFFGLNGLRLGISGYYGNTESSEYQGLDREDAAAVTSADSTRVSVAMTAFNAQYNISNFQFTFIGSYSSIGNTLAYNQFNNTDVANSVLGYYGEIAYAQKLKSGQSYPQLVPFVRYENYNTHHSVDDNLNRNTAYHKEELTVGAGLRMTPGTMLKTDFQWVKTESNPRPFNVVNIGFGYWF